MSLDDTVVKQTYQGNGSNTTFAIPFAIIVDDSDETQVYLRDESVSPASEELLTEGVDYTLIGATPPTQPFAVNVSMVTAPSSDEKLIIIRELPLTQTLDLTTNGDQRPESTEEELDRIVAMIQQLDEKLSRTAILPITEQEAQLNLPEPIASRILGYNSAGDDLRLYSFDEISAAADADFLTPKDYLDLVIQSAPGNPDAGYYRYYITSDFKLRAKDSLGNVQVIDSRNTQTNTRSTPQSVTAVGGVTASLGEQKQTVYVQGDSAAIEVTASTPITLSDIIGAELIIVGRSDTNTVTLQNTSGKLELNGDIVLGENDVLGLLFDGVAWVEMYRNV